MKVGSVSLDWRPSEGEEERLIRIVVAFSAMGWMGRVGSAGWI